MTEDIPGADSRGRRHVFRNGDGGGDLGLDLQLGSGDEGRDDSSGATHIHDHVPHLGARLQGDTAGIEGHALTHQGDFWEIRRFRSLRRPSRGVGHAHQAGRILGTLTHADDSPEALLAELILIQDLHLQTSLGGSIPDDLGISLRVEVIGRRVHQITGKRYRFRDDVHALHQLRTFLGIQHDDRADGLLGLGLLPGVGISTERMTQQRSFGIEDAEAGNNRVRLANVPGSTARCLAHIIIGKFFHITQAHGQDLGDLWLR